MLHCRQCGLPENPEIVFRARSQTSSGGWQYFWWCINCGNYATYPTFFTKPQDWDKLPIIDRGYKSPRCCVTGCMRHDTQLHHFLPKEIANFSGVDPEAYPKDWLCGDFGEHAGHHKQWHELLTPWIFGKNWKERFDRMLERYPCTMTTAARVLVGGESLRGK